MGAQSARFIASFVLQDHVSMQISSQLKAWNPSPAAPPKMATEPLALQIQVSPQQAAPFAEQHHESNREDRSQSQVPDV